MVRAASLCLGLFVFLKGVVMIKPIETIYNGYRFRSRLEARWAIFFDMLQVKYEYEKEGFDVDGVWYLPDFYLPDYSCWVEIKPDSFIDGSDPKINKFAKATKDTFILISGIPRADKYIYGCAEDERYIVRILAFKNMDNRDVPEFFNDYPYAFALARRSTMPELCIEGKFSAHNLINNTTDDGERPPIKYNLKSAYEAAMQARFDSV